MPPSIRLLPYETSDAATNMAADEAMLETAAAEGLASIRFYGWSEPSLSLGYFQPSPNRAESPSLAAVPWVRRSTGGAGILHHHELTYAFALPAREPWRSTSSWICRFHHLVSDELAAIGLAARLVLCGEERKLGEVLCFLHQTPGDLVWEGSKVAGSAQRKLRGALLQHGSILLRRSEHAPQLPGLEDLAGRALFSPRVLADRLSRRFASDTGTSLQPGMWTERERERIAAIRAEKYANPDWTARR